jgi:pyridoxal 5'-phosphate synthase pdxS subunit
MSEVTGTSRVKRGMAEMLKGGVIMDVVSKRVSQKMQALLL